MLKFKFNIFTGTFDLVNDGLDEKLNLSGGVLTGELVMEGDLNGTGTVNLKAQSTSPNTPTSGVRLYASQNEHFSWRGQGGQSIELDTNALSDERTVVFPDANGTILLDPLTTDGDILYRSSGTSTRLPIGTQAQKLMVNSGLPIWSDSGFEFFSGGTSGNLTLSGPLTLAEDVFYDTLTLNVGAALNTNGCRIFCKTLDLSNAPASAIRRGGSNGINASAQTGGGTQPGLNSITVGGGGQGGAGATGVVGAGAIAAAAGGFVNANGGNSGAGGAGGAGTPNAGGASRAASTATTGLIFSRIAYDLLRGTVLIGGGAGGPGGSSGGGDGTNLGRGGGGGGSSGAVIAIYAHTIITSNSTAASAIVCNGGNGGIGASATVGNVGGGGGGGGAGGGYVYIMYAKKVGPVVTNLINASGGNGGNAGNGFGTGIGGNGGGGGTGGRIQLFNVTTGVGTLIVGNVGTNGNAASGTTGGTGGIGGTCNGSL